MSSVSRASTGLTSTPKRRRKRLGLRPTDRSRRAHWRSRITAARVTRGAICLSSSSHFPLMPNSNWVKPVALPPGRARLATKPAPTGSMVCANTIGTVRVACSNGGTAVRRTGQDHIRRESDQFDCISAKALGIASHPNECRCAGCGRRSSPIAASPCRRQRAEPALPHRPQPYVMSTPTRRIRPACCARAASGQAAAAPPSSVMNSRRLIRSPRRRWRAASAARRGRASWRSRH